MLSVARIRNRNYLLNLAREDYYEQGGEPPGKWHGQGAELLGLTGEVNKEDLLQLMKGFSVVDKTKKLVSNAGNSKREIGWDFTFSVPKSVSVIWSQADSRTRNAIERIQESAVRKTLDWLEERAIRRKGKGGTIYEPAKLVTALFEHGTSRAVDEIPDPNLHTHVVLLNLGIQSAKDTGALLIKELLNYKMLAGAFYRAELAKQLTEKLGYEIGEHLEGKVELFDVKNVDPMLVTTFSKRRKQIEGQLETKGVTGAIASAVATLDTRSKKKEINRKELFAVWQEMGKCFNYQPPTPTFKQQNGDQAKEQLGKEALERLLEQGSSFTRDELMRLIASAAAKRGLGIDEIRQVTESVVSRNELVCLGGTGGRTRYVKRATHERAKQWIAAVETGNVSLELAAVQWRNQLPVLSIATRSPACERPLSL